MTEAVLPPPDTVAVRPLVAGNWKMNGAKQGLEEALAIRDALAVTAVAADVMICPPATLLMVMAEILSADEDNAQLQLGGQD